MKYTLKDIFFNLIYLNELIDVFFFCSFCENLKRIYKYLSFILIIKNLIFEF